MVFGVTLSGTNDALTAEAVGDDADEDAFCVPPVSRVDCRRSFGLAAAS